MDAACAAVGRDPATVVRSVGVSFPAAGFTGDPATVAPDSVEGQVQLLNDLGALGFGQIRIGVQPFSIEAVAALEPVVQGFFGSR